MTIRTSTSILLISIVSCLLTACVPTSDLGQIKEGFETKPDTYDAMMKYANDCSQKGKYEKASQWYHNAIANAEGEWGPNDGRIASAAMYDAALCRSLNKLGEAEEMYKRAYEIQSKLLPPNSPQLTEVKKAYAETLVADYKLDEAKKIYPAVRTPADALKTAPKSRGKGKH